MRAKTRAEIIDSIKGDTLATRLGIETWYYTAEDLIDGTCPTKVIELANQVIKADKTLIDKDILYMLRKEDVNAFKIRIRGAAGDEFGEMCLYTYHTEVNLNSGIDVYDRDSVLTYKCISIADIEELLTLKAIATTTIPGRVYAPSGITKEVVCNGDSFADIEEHWVLDIIPGPNLPDMFK